MRHIESVDCTYQGRERMSEYTPSTEEVRNGFANNQFLKSGRDVAHLMECADIHWAEFDRWLAEHDAEVVARTLAAQSTGGVCQVFDADLEWRDWVKDAEGLIKGENE